MCKMCTKIMSTAIVIIALILAIVVSIWHQQVITYIVSVSRFFDVMIPVLAVGALLKYLLCCGGSNSSCHQHEHDSCKKD